MTDETDDAADDDFDDDPNDGGNGEPTDRRSRGLRARQLQRVFDLLEAAVGEDARLNDERADRLLAVLESITVDPDRLDPDEVDQLLSVLETAISESTRQSIDGVLSVLEAAVTDPAGLDSREGEGLLSLLDAAGFDVDSWDETVDANLADDDRSDRSDRSDLTDLADPFRIARIAAAATQRATEYSTRSGIRTGTGMARAAATSESLAELLDETRAVAFDELRRAGVDVGDARQGGADRGRGDRWRDDGPSTGETLRERGARLLDQSADVEYEETVHPAYARILANLAPDEARILRLLATEGPQPSVDVRDAGWLPFGSTPVAAGLNMTGERAGCRYEERTSTYLNNLQRLGLVRFADEPVEDRKHYQVLEAQPDVEAAMAAATRAKTVRRSIHLTPLGVDFCVTCMPFEVTAADAADAASAHDHHVDPSE